MQLARQSGPIPGSLLAERWKAGSTSGSGVQTAPGVGVVGVAPRRPKALAAQRATRKGRIPVTRAAVAPRLAETREGTPMPIRNSGPAQKRLRM
jgi:hypothetical protein